ncbi:hypothetical protein [Planktothricoides raciborskii]|uniref:Uncharacterized protein n=1 Tax=Planktothricoides raciborskii FACHB-1370 TaxID=2949576 RepID=A0ABR8EDK4_9CYAN|nr:hypothetical protein [Planktothricoides raciborskii]MBD2544863.1 hypothetical protein [Planktothricoides raciborskii FACHB-1370]MBD2583041.1 hypothetical protein [Planktothricoides raciborskii FACHB-1261]
MKELPRSEMLPALIQRLNNESGIDLSRITEHTLWESFENGSAHFVVRNSQIVGCGVIWHYDLKKSGQEPAYVELGTVWAEKKDRLSILGELRDNIPRLAKGKKIMLFCSKIKLAIHFRNSPLFPVNTIGDRVINFSSRPETV